MRTYESTVILDFIIITLIKSNVCVLLIETSLICSAKNTNVHH